MFYRAVEMIPDKADIIEELLEENGSTSLDQPETALMNSSGSSESNNSIFDLPFPFNKPPTTATFSAQKYSNPPSLENIISSYDDEDIADLSFGWSPIEPSIHAQQTINPIRSIVDVMNVPTNPDKELIRLNIGDPSVSGTLPVHPNVCQAVIGSLTSGKYNGYGPAIGFPEVRQAVAESCVPKVTADDIVLTSGCSHAIQMAIEALADAGQNVLVPRPGFPLYSTLMRPLGVEERHYDLLPDHNWQVDLEHMASLIDAGTAAIVVNNPSNPCGAVYSREHLEQILRLAELYRVPIIADEIYGNMIYGGAKFYPMASLQPRVPMLTCDGISKRYLVPGWRLGWVIINDVDGALSKVRHGIRQLAQKIVGPCAIIQGAVPAILRNTPPDFFEHTRRVLSQNADVVCQTLAKAPGLRPIRSQGAMYIMVAVDMPKFSAFRTELEFIQALLAEEAVYCLPGSAFSYPGAFRIVLTSRKESMQEACQRIRSFCVRHYGKAAVPAAHQQQHQTQQSESAARS